MNPIIKLSDNAADRIKEIMSSAEKDALGVRVSVKSGGCAGMSYVMEYSKELNPNDEVIEDKDREFLTQGGVLIDDQIDAYIALKFEEIHKFEHAPHPVEFEMYYSC